MRWLHLTDIHMGLGNESQILALQSLTVAISHAVGDQPMHAILMSGDLANAGQQDQYRQLADELLNPLRQLAPFAEATVVAVPGNHDVDCGVALPTTWSSLGARRQNVFFDHSAEGRQLRQQRTVGFSAFSSFLQSESCEGLDPSVGTSRTVRLSDGLHSVAFVCLNTALFSDMDESDHGATPAPVSSLRRELHQLSATHHDGPVFVLGHHPFEWFIHTTIRQFRSALAEHEAVYLHGHIHEPTITNSQRGLESLGFGASYQAPLEASPDPQYQNAFAVCEYDGDLHVALYAWDALNGRWIRKTDLSHDFSVQSPVLQDGYLLKLPQSSASRRSLPTSGSRIRESGPDPERVIPLSPMTERSWWGLMQRCGVIGVAAKRLRSKPSPGEVDVLVDEPSGPRLYRCIEGQGHILSRREIEAENTRLDTGEHASLTIVSLGDADHDARQLVARLQAKKPIVVLTNADLASELHRRLMGPVASHIRDLRSDTSRLFFTIGDGGVGLLVLGDGEAPWFYAVDPEGHCLPESHDVVRALRGGKLEIGSSVYSPPGKKAHHVPSTPQVAFDRNAYLESCKREFDSLRYAPLAAVGFALPTTRLLDVYEPAGAEVAAQDTYQETLANAVDDLLDTFDLNESLRSQFRSQLLGRMASGGPRESGAAQAFYQQYRNILLLGDPGSGKTCFVKSEILNYCEKDEDGSWYGFHIPVFVPLAEASALHRKGTLLLDICATLARRRGLEISTDQLQRQVECGAVAFFFDGLDEIPSLEVRQRVVGAIEEVLSTAVPLGNRVVLTSRPAAVEPIELPPTLQTLHLRGLSRQQIENLASRILQTELARGGTKVRFADGTDDSNTGVLEELLNDVDAKPGIARLARNPLLLTLLVMVYANAGAPAAKRHRVYAQAVQTLVTVRSRGAGQTVLPEADLRKRLGAVALATYTQALPAIPSRTEVLSTFAETFRAEGRGEESDVSACEFLRLVSENTGLLSIHATPDGEASVTFMHHSFLEYYAAVALVATCEPGSIASLVGERRWEEVVAISAGIVGDQGDVGPLVDGLLKDRPTNDRMSESRMLYAFDCALECEVPPDRVQRVLIDEVLGSLATGAGRLDSYVRGALADRLARLVTAAGDVGIADTLAASLTPDCRGAGVPAPVVAATLDLLSRVCVQVDISASIGPAIDKVCATRKEAVVQVAVCDAVARCSRIRSKVAVSLVRNCFGKSGQFRYAAARAVENAPALARDLRDVVIECTKDIKVPIAAAAARALLEARLVSTSDPNERVLLERCLRRWQEFAQPRRTSPLELEVAHSEVDALLSSPEGEDYLVGIRLLPWLQRNERYVYTRLFEIISQESAGRALIASLEALPMAPGVAPLLTTRDAATVKEHLVADHTTRDVKVAATRALEIFPEDAEVTSLLLRACATSTDYLFREQLRVLVAYAPSDPRVQEFVSTEARKRISDARRGEFGRDSRQRDTRRVLHVLGELGVEAPTSFTDALVRVASAYKTPKPLKYQCRVTFGRTAAIGAENANTLAYWLKGDEKTVGVDGAACSAVRDFVLRAHRRLPLMRRIYSSLDALEEAVHASWGRLVRRSGGGIDNNPARNLRATVVAITEIRTMCEEPPPSLRERKVELSDSASQGPP